MEKENKRGGARPGAGRPIGSTKKEPSNVRPQHQLRADDTEWDLIRRFARLVKHGKLEECKKILEKLEM